MRTQPLKKAWILLLELLIYENILRENITNTLCPNNCFAVAQV